MNGIFGAISAGFEAKSEASTRVGALEEMWGGLWGGGPSKSGTSVSVDTALKVTTVLACARRIAEAIMVPCKVYKREPGTESRRAALDHPLYAILEDAPNPYQSGLEYRETIGLHLALTFNHYSLISRVRGRIDELTPLDPGAVTQVANSDGTVAYRVNLDGKTSTTFAASEIWHVRGPSWTGKTGMEAIKLTREAIGLAIAAEETHARFHSNGAQPGGILTTEQKLTDQARARLKAQWTQQQVGIANRFKTVVLDSGLQWQQMTMTGVDAQHIELRRLQIEEICRAMCVMPIMVGFLGDKSATYASSEQMFLAHLVHTVRPIHDRVAASARRWLLTPEEKGQGYYVAFTEEAFLSPAMKDKAEFYKIALGGGGNPGWLTPNEVRAHQELPPELGGSRLYVPTNTTPIGHDGFPRPIQKPDPTPAGA